MPLLKEHADQIATLLNERNQLIRPYTYQDVLEHKENYLVHISESGKVVACVEVKGVQWYQAEILHLTVAATEIRKGHAKALLQEAERISREKNARLLQCTIREDNVESCSLFEGFGFSSVNTFYNSRSGNNITVYQKVLSSAR
ncbi:GNAT family N-acetyltransferase [Ampullimonas aquatilis]|uniref:GNAT family N-acetyltransferase n=1 Tax=Ampullimonas aquatilis TaxID=1341549 RepID=UPI003C785E61